MDTNDGTLTGGTNPNGSQYAFNNQGTQGVTATAVAAAGSGLPGDPRTQTQGLEARIHLADLGYSLPLAGDLTITAPIAGTITAKNIEIGREVSPGLKVAEVSQSGMLKIEIGLTAEEAARLTPGQEAFVAVNGSEAEARVFKIYPAVDPVSRKVPVEILFDNRDKALVPGSFATVALPIAKANGKSLFIPLKAVTVTPSGSFVWLDRGGRAEKRTVETGLTDGDRIEVRTPDGRFLARAVSHGSACSPQLRQTNPSGQRNCRRYARQSASSRNHSSIS